MDLFCDDLFLDGPCLEPGVRDVDSGESPALHSDTPKERGEEEL